MSIKTDQLPQNAAPQLTDTLLLADSAGGTAQLSLAQAAAFFGSEMVKAWNPVGAALSSKAALSAQEAVELTAPGRREVTLAASELPVYVKSLPRLLAEILVVTVEQGTVPSSLELEGFYGPGMLRINGNNSVLNGGIKIERCGVYVNLANFDVRGTVTVGGGSYAAYSAFSPNVILDRIKIDGAQNSEDHSELIGVRGNGCGMITMLNFQVSNVGTVLLVTDASIAAVIDCNCSGNQTGAHVFKGGMILLAGSTPDTMGGISNVNQGGLIVKSDGTLL